MTVQIEHIDPYRQRYVTITEQVISGLQVTTEIYTPYLYGQPFETRTIQNEDGSRSIEVRGIITNIIQTLAGSGLNTTIVAEGCETEIAWIEIWRSCTALPSANFAYTLDCCIVGAVEHEVVSGPAFIPPVSGTGGGNLVVWADVSPAGAILPPATGTALEFIDVWS